MNSSYECTILEAESLLSFPNGETDLGGIGVDDGFSCAKEWSSQNDGCSIISSCFCNIPDFYAIQKYELFKNFLV
jgi:hypothetical protein